MAVWLYFKFRYLLYTRVVLYKFYILYDLATFHPSFDFHMY